MKQSFTPGPWTVNETWGLVMANNERIEVAACHAGVMEGQERNSPKVAAANARLIAAAPELLEALRGVVQHLERNELAVVRGIQLDNEATKYMRAELSAIITKATGQSGKGGE